MYVNGLINEDIWRLYIYTDVQKIISRCKFDKTGLAMNAMDKNRWNYNINCNEWTQQTYDRFINERTGISALTEAEMDEMYHYFK